ncbi:MAG: NAD/NADP octopine/nopaline dehydrogenase family protein [bacterium]
MVGIWGAGNQGFALYSYLYSKGIYPLCYTRNRDNLRIKEIRSLDKVEGFYKFNVTNNLNDLLENEIIFITTITTAYEEVAQKICQYASNFDFSKKIFVLFSGKLGGVLVFNEILKKNCIHTNIIETDAIFACRKVDSSSVWIRGIKRWNLLISNKDWYKSEKNLEIYGKIKEIFSDINLEVADNFIQRGLTDFGAMAHAVISLINLANIDNKKDLLFYIDGITENTVILIQKVYEEFNKVAQFFNTEIIHPTELLDRYYGTVKDNLLLSIKNVPNYKYTKMPDNINNRFLYEDVFNTMYPLSLIAKEVGINIILVPSIVNIISFVLNLDLSRGRTLEKMGLSKDVLFKIKNEGLISGARG